MFSKVFFFLKKKSCPTQDKYNWYFRHFKFDMATVLHWELAIWRCSSKAWVLFHTTPCLAAPMLLILEDLRTILSFCKNTKCNTNFQLMAYKTQELKFCRYTVPVWQVILVTEALAIWPRLTKTVCCYEAV